MNRVISKKNLALLGGVTSSAITELATGTFSGAMWEGRINIDHPNVRAWLEGRGLTNIESFLPQFLEAADGTRTGGIGSEADMIRNAALSPDAPPVDNISGYDIKDLEHLTVREVVLRHGSIEGFKRFVEALKNIAEYKFRELRVQLQRGELIDRTRVAKSAFALIDVAFARLVSDVPDTVSQQVIACVEAGGDNVANEVHEMLRAANSKILKNLKVSITKMGFLHDEK